jgi:hypothetical protein
MTHIINRRKINRRKINRRKALAVVAAVPAAAVLGRAQAADIGELPQLIKKHRAAYRAFTKTIDRHEALRDRVVAGEPIVPCLLGGGYLKHGYEFCQEQILSAYTGQSDRLGPLSHVAPELADQARAVMAARQKETLELLDRMWEESGLPASDQEWEAASDAEDEAFSAVCSYRCRTPDEARLKAEYLLTTSTVKDNWDDEAKALLQSFV